MILRFRRCFSSIKTKPKSPYTVLELDRQTSQQEIKNKYYELAQKYHPDRSPHFVQKFKEINEAYNMLKDPSKRKQIDDSIDNKGGVAYSRTYYTNTKHNYGHGANTESSDQDQYRHMKSSSSRTYGYQSKNADYWGKSNFYGKSDENPGQRRSVQKVGELQRAWKNWGVVLISIGLLFGVVEMVFKVYEMNTKQVRKSSQILRSSRGERMGR